MILQEGNLFAGRYVLEKSLGAGGFGEVWKAFDKVTEKFVAIKIHHKGDTERAAQEIVKEYTRVMNIHHDNLLTPSHVDLAEGNVPYLVMELCEYDLSDRDLTEQEVWQLIRDVASGLKRLADNKKTRVRSDGTTSEVSDPIIHQDIKPANILLRSNGMYAISDFGISKRRLSTLSTNDQNGQTQQMDSAMTVDYAAPERFPRGVGKAVLASDIWSLGAMLFEIVEGKRPFDDGGGDCLNQGIPIPTITREGYSDELKSVIFACMEKNPADRPTAAQLKDYAGKVLKGEPRIKQWMWMKMEPEIKEKVPLTNKIFRKSKKYLEDLYEEIDYQLLVHEWIKWLLLMLILVLVCWYGFYLYSMFENNEKKAFRIARQENSLKSYKSFIEQNKNGQYVGEALNCIVRLADAEHNMTGLEYVICFQDSCDINNCLAYDTSMVNPALEARDSVLHLYSKWTTSAKSFRDIISNYSFDRDYSLPSELDMLEKIVYGALEIDSIDYIFSSFYCSKVTDSSGRAFYSNIKDSAFLFSDGKSWLVPGAVQVDTLVFRVSIMIDDVLRRGKGQLVEGQRYSPEGAAKMCYGKALTLVDLYFNKRKVIYCDE